ncbi:MAG: glycine betaine/L-proline ABC transporter ATP-binding protein [Thermaerobacterales bacterium]
MDKEAGAMAGEPDFTSANDTAASARSAAEQAVEPKISVSNIYKVFGNNPKKALSLLKKGQSKDDILNDTEQAVGLAGVSFDVKPGEIFIVMGLSGSGKSTLVRCINRLIEPTSGQIAIDGQNVISMSQKELRQLRLAKMGMIFQRFALWPHRTLLDNVAYGLEIQGVKKAERHQRAGDMLQTVGLAGWETRYPRELSGGMQQRVGLARALAPDPDILLMDEPFSALDPLIRREMQDELLDLQERLNKTILFITHDLDEALKLGDRIAIMKDGVIVQIGTPEDILLRPADDYVRSFVEDVDRAKILQARDVMFRPDALVRANQSPRLALREMEQEGLSSVFVVGPNRSLMGVVTADDAVEAANRGDRDLQKILITEVPVTAPDLPLRELIPQAIEARFPIAVIDDDRRLLGIIVRVSVLKGLVDGQNSHAVDSVDRPEDVAAAAESRDAG